MTKGELNLKGFNTLKRRCLNIVVLPLAGELVSSTLRLERSCKVT